MTNRPPTKRKRLFSSLIELAAGGTRSSVALHIMTLERFKPPEPGPRSPT
jgi:hypothetical protein